MNLAEEITPYLLIALVHYLGMFGLLIKEGERQNNMVIELDQTVGSGARKDWKIRRMCSGLRGGLEATHNHMFGASSQISCMTLAKSFNVSASNLSNGGNKPCLKNPIILGGR